MGYWRNGIKSYLMQFLKLILFFLVQFRSVEYFIICGPITSLMAFDECIVHSELVVDNKIVSQIRILFSSESTIIKLYKLFIFKYWTWNIFSCRLKNGEFLD